MLNIYSSNQRALRLAPESHDICGEVELWILRVKTPVSGVGRSHRLSTTARNSLRVFSISLPQGFVPGVVRVCVVSWLDNKILNFLSTFMDSKPVV